MVDPDGVANRPEDPFVRNRAGAGGPRRDVVTLAGLLGDSDRDGYRRLYLTTQLDYFVEFRTDEVVTVEDVAPGDAPFPGLDATRLTLTGDATLDWVHRATAATDPFALEVSNAIVLPPFVETWEARCIGVTVHFGQSDFDRCGGGGGGGGGGHQGGGTFGPWPTERGLSCASCIQDTCATCNQGTCVTCAGGTCQTCRGARCATMPGTCQTCAQVTCDLGCVVTATCATCITCDDTCATCWDSCVGTCVSCRGTCDATCANTCGETCANTCWPTCSATCDTCHTCQFQTCGCPVSDPAWCIVRA